MVHKPFFIILNKKVLSLRRFGILPVFYSAINSVVLSEPIPIWPKVKTIPIAMSTVIKWILSARVICEAKYDFTLIA